ncbi:hypothetical protein RJ640_004234 [Escallonia rubra]|uniref:Protein kinase domain-containing protein n=1 Tax=Escallonia rubra TaxID=112253 RepID=A0AA88QWM4_9ASTE|nr:hypothetical protein RJ640_004234 [Escallonia rubra]
MMELSFCVSLTMLLLLFPLTFIPTATSDLASDRAALLALRSAVGGRTLLWNASQDTPCQWAGVQCDGDRVAALRLPGVSLSGQLPVGTVGNLTRLRTLSLRLNALSGPLPSDLSSCLDLRNLYLHGNRFSGPVPGFLFTLHGLVRLNLAGNNFSGEISPGFNNLTRLRTLYLQNNRFSGPIPDLKLANLDQFNVSFNQLNGSVPESLRSQQDTCFLGNSLCGPPLESCPSHGIALPPATAGTVSGKNEKGLSGGAIAGIVIGSVLGLLLLLLLLFVLCRRRRSSPKTRSVDVAAVKQSEVDNLGEKPLTEAEAAAVAGSGYPTAAKADVVGAGVGKKLVFFGNAAGRVFDLEDLLRASAEVLGKGTFGTAYKAVLEAGIVVAVKRLKEVTISEAEFRDKIELVGAMDHENLVPLRAYYYSREEKLLVYDYMPMGSLSALLHGNKDAGRSPLSWEIRSSIALATARGIAYLHSQGSDVSHGNIRSSNVLLTKSYEARVSDFGLAHLVGTSSTPNRVAGYRAPEVTDPRKVSQRADVYSFGVFLLELLTGKPPTNSLMTENGVDLPRWVQSVVREEWTSEVFDPELLRYQNVEEEMVQLLQLGIDCAAQYPDNRPSISEVTMRIEELCRLSSRNDKSEQPDLVNETL